MVSKGTEIVPHLARQIKILMGLVQLLAEMLQLL